MLNNIIDSINKFFDEKLVVYENGSNTLIFVIAAFVLGMIIACISTAIEIKGPGKIVRALYIGGAGSERTALFAEEIGYTPKKLARAVRKPKALSRFVCHFTDEESGREKYYLNPKHTTSAIKRYDAKKANVRTLIFCIILLIALGVVLTFIIPDLRQMVENFIGMFVKEAENG